MDVREKLVEILKQAPFEGKVLDEWWWEEKIKRIADHLIMNGVTVREWIPVAERLPEEEGLYLVAVVNDHERRYSKTAWYHGHGNWFLHQKVTHWMPLPRPPKGE